MTLNLFLLSFLFLVPHFAHQATIDVDTFKNFDEQNEVDSFPSELEKNGTIEIPKNCKEIQQQGRKSDVYLIQPKLARKPFDVFCDMETSGGGWVYLLNRFNGSQPFYLDWEEYKIGFGDLRGEFWLGLDNMHYLTDSESNELLIELNDWDSDDKHAFYKSFKVGNESTGYVLSVSEYSGDAGDSFSRSSGRKFSTKDKDQDIFSGHCAQRYIGAWWYDYCAGGQLTGQYMERDSKFFCCRGIYWETFRGLSYSLKGAKMMIRPRQ